MRSSRAPFIVIAAYALLASLVIPVYPHFVSANEFSRWIVAVAVVEFHTVEVTRAVDATHTRNEDLSTIGGQLYSNKAPGAAMAGLPAYAIVRVFAGPPSPANIRATLNAMRLLASTVPTILLALWFVAVARKLGCSEDRVSFAVAALLFGTPLFAYGLLFFAHALSAFALFGAFALLFLNEDRGEPRTEEWFAGALIGLAVLAEYPSAIPGAVMFACALPILRFRGAMRLIVGGLPFAIILGVYNRIAFGSFFALSSALESHPFYREIAQRGLFGIGVPSPVTLAHLLIDPAKGLFVFSPVLLIAFLGFRRANHVLSRSAFAALLLTPASIVIMFSGYPNWDGGWTVGPRYLVPALPFLALLIAFASQTILDALLLGASVTVIAIVSLVFPFVGIDYPAPWVSFSWPILRDGHVVPNLFHLVGQPLAIAVPFAIVIVAACVAVGWRRVPLLIAGGILWFLAGLVIARTRTFAPNIRAVVEEVHFRDSGAIDRALPRGDANISSLKAIARRMEQSPPDF
jgi:hypothetical protein